MDCSSYYAHSSSVSRPTSNKEKKGNNNGKRSKAVKLSTDPQSVAARERRHRISDRFKVLQSLVPGGAKMDTVSMLEEAIQYVKFLKTQIWLHQTMIKFVTDEYVDPSLYFHPTSSSSVLLPHAQQQCLYSPEDLVVVGHENEVQSTVLAGLPDSGFRAEQTMAFDGSMNY